MTHVTNLFRTAAAFALLLATHSGWASTGGDDWPAWGGPHVESNRSFAALLKSRGLRFTGGEVHAGAGWGSWKNRIGRVFETFFPLSRFRE